ncbi:MAG: DUF1295 domain-containing protein [Chitinophagaceae bacterium]|nr:DUF1295 domain-containing protein [Chitinophagaceae bacterium]
MLAKYREQIIAYTCIFLAYAISFSTAFIFILYFEKEQSMLQETFYASIVATVMIFLFSILFRNASFYDPYWSIAPFAICFYWTTMTQMHYSLRFDFLLLSFLAWGFRLTANWLKRWNGLKHQDWRYTELKSNAGIFYPFVNLFGIHLFPTAIVFLCMLPVYFAVRQPLYDTGFIDVVAFMVCLTATIIELVADEQQRIFRENRKSEEEFCYTGLWRYSRHPNYFGEVLFWWGIYLFVLHANLNFWWTIIGPVAMTLMFFFVSIPMMEQHLLKKYPNYVGYRIHVSMLVPWF